MGNHRDLAVGATLGRYELVMRIASGGMGEVWAARLRGSRGFQKLVAIKTLLPELSQDPNFEQMFLDEASLAARIKHPNVVEVIDLGEEEQVLYQTMEWVEGASLWAVMRAAAKRKHKALPVMVAASILYQVCAGLHAAHELKDADGNVIGVVHRDVSPQNVLITPEGMAKLVDFGVARFSGRKSAVTQIGELRGKVPYMAPEAIRAEPLDRRADVFAAGLILYQLIAGVHPFLGDSDTITLARLSNDQPPPPLRERVPAVSQALSDLVDRAMKKNPADRIATAGLFMRELERVVPGAGSAAGREEVAAFCNALGSEHFPARAGAVRAALRRLDDPLAEAPASVPSLLSSGGARQPSTVTGVGDQDDEPIDIPGVQRRGLRGWMIAAGAVVVVGGLAAAFAFSGSGPSPSAAAPPATPSAAPVATVPAATTSAPIPTQAAPAPPIPSATPSAAPAPSVKGGPMPAAGAGGRKPGKVPGSEFKPGGI